MSETVAMSWGDSDGINEVPSFIIKDTNFNDSTQFPNALRTQSTSTQGYVLPEHIFIKVNDVSTNFNHFAIRDLFLDNCTKLKEKLTMRSPLYNLLDNAFINLTKFPALGKFITFIAKYFEVCSGCTFNDDDLNLLKSKISRCLPSNFVNHTISLFYAHASACILSGKSAYVPTFRNCNLTEFHENGVTILQEWTNKHQFINKHYDLLISVEPNIDVNQCFLDLFTNLSMLVDIEIERIDFIIGSSNILKKTPTVMLHVNNNTNVVTISHPLFWNLIHCINSQQLVTNFAFFIHQKFAISIHQTDLNNLNINFTNKEFNELIILTLLDLLSTDNIKNTYDYIKFDLQCLNGNDFISSSPSFISCENGISKLKILTFSDLFLSSFTGDTKMIFLNKQIDSTLFSTIVSENNPCNLFQPRPHTSFAYIGRILDFQKLQFEEYNNLFRFEVNRNNSSESVNSPFEINTFWDLDCFKCFITILKLFDSIYGSAFKIKNNEITRNHFLYHVIQKVKIVNGINGHYLWTKLEKPIMNGNPRVNHSYLLSCNDPQFSIIDYYDIKSELCIGTILNGCAVDLVQPNYPFDSFSLSYCESQYMRNCDDNNYFDGVLCPPLNNKLIPFKKQIIVNGFGLFILENYGILLSRLSYDLRNKYNDKITSYIKSQIQKPYKTKKTVTKWIE